MALIHLTNEAFDKATASGLAMVDFWATWCGPCKMLSPVIDGLVPPGPPTPGGLPATGTNTPPGRPTGPPRRFYLLLTNILFVVYSMLNIE